MFSLVYIVLSFLSLLTVTSYGATLLKPTRGSASSGSPTLQYASQKLSLGKREEILPMKPYTTIRAAKPEPSSCHKRSKRDVHVFWENGIYDIDSLLPRYQVPGNAEDSLVPRFLGPGEYPIEWGDAKKPSQDCEPDEEECGKGYCCHLPDRCRIGIYVRFECDLKLHIRFHVCRTPNKAWPPSPL